MAKGRGYNELGALNNIIMVYPTTKCWDEDLTDANFNEQTGVIPSAIKAMIERVTSTGAGDGGNSGDNSGDNGGGNNGDGNTVDAACTAYDAQINSALASIESIRQFLTGAMSEFTSID